MFNTFEVGDKVKCIYNFNDCDGPKEGSTYKVISVDSNYIGVRLKYPNNIKIALGELPNWGIKCFKLVSKCEPMNEVEWLDKVQQNFKE